MCRRRDLYRGREIRSTPGALRGGAPKESCMQIERIRVLRGPNIWAYRPVFEIWLNIGRFE